MEASEFQRGSAAGQDLSFSRITGVCDRSAQVRETRCNAASAQEGGRRIMGVRGEERGGVGSQGRTARLEREREREEILK